VRVCVVGATGNIGAPLVARLLDAGHAVVAVSRSGVRREAALLSDLRVDLEAGLPDGLTDGCDGLFLLSGWSQQRELLARAASDGVRRVVATSGVSAALEDTNPFTLLQRGTENAVHAAGIPAAVLRLHALASNTARWAGRLDDLREPYPDDRSSAVHPEDVADCAFAALTAEAFPDGTHRLTGPTPLSARERLAELAEVLGRPLALEEVPEAELRAARNEWTRAAVVLHALSDESEVSPDVRRLTGHEPRTHRGWCEANAAIF
jgi:(4-alkanoyl-5-oxo-2,5-dihydrofuran-3-yl)methyl phosphate reductase